MNLLLLLSTAHALTLDEAVRRAAEVDPDALVSELTAHQARLDAAGAWVQLGPTPSISASRRFAAGTVADTNGVRVSLDVLDPVAWADAGSASALARSLNHTAHATSLDAQYAAATLFYTVLSTEAALAAAQEGERFAQATTEATSARVSAGLESELAGRSARLGLLEAQATTAQSEADVAIARATLSRALQQDVDALEAPTGLLAIPDATNDSPWIDAAEAQLAMAKWDHAAAIAGLFPSGSIAADSTLGALGDWSLTLGVTWQFDGVAGPFLKARRAALEQRIEVVQLDAVERDLALGLTTAREQARAADRVAEAARAREELANESLQVGQTRLSVGLASSLEVLRLQDDAAEARSDRVNAELDAATARLEARRVAGLGW
ncbi:MAG: TolC family protein [Pseudomonadota bacterium]|nr:TolC family protein [Pseudomonadota bacterium]